MFRNSVGITLVVVLLLALFGLAYGGETAEARSENSSAATVEKIESGTYKLDPAHTVVGFGVEHLGIAIVKGRFKDVEGTIDYNAADITRSTVKFSAKIDSVDTGVAPRDTHLRSADFFDAAKYPEMTFASTKIEKKGKRYTMHGDLTIKGVTRPVSFPFTFTEAIKDPWGGTRFGAAAATELNRRDFGINYGNQLPGGGLDVAAKVGVELHLEAVKVESK